MDLHSQRKGLAREQAESLARRKQGYLTFSEITSRAKIGDGRRCQTPTEMLGTPTPDPTVRKDQGRGEEPTGEKCGRVVRGSDGWLAVRVGRCGWGRLEVIGGG